MIFTVVATHSIPVPCCESDVVISRSSDGASDGEDQEEDRNWAPPISPDDYAKWAGKVRPQS